MNKEQKTSKTDLELANEALAALRENVTSSDRKNAPASVATVVQYLKGEGQELDTAIKLLTYFRSKIQARRRLIDGTDVDSEVKDSVQNAA